MSIRPRGELPPIRESAAFGASLRSVPDSVFTNGFNKTIITPSGNTLLCVVSLHHVSIFDPSEIINPGHPDIEFDDPTYRFTAGLSATRDGGASMSLYYRNRDPLSDHPHERHPDIHPSALALRALEYFRFGGSKITSMDECWPETLQGRPVAADNWTAYQREVRRAMHWWQGQPTDKQMRSAASRTKDGILAARLGFPQVVHVEVERLHGRDRAIRARFAPGAPER